MSWPLLLLDSVAERGSGHTPSQKHPEYWDDGIKWVSLADSSALDRRYIFDTAKKISKLGLRHSSAVLHPKGTVIVSRDAGVGKSAILGDEMCVIQTFIAWRCDDKRLCSEYLYQWLQSEKTEFERIATGSTVKTIGLGYFQKLRVPVPPIGIQRSIARALDAWDTAIQKADQLIASKERRLRQWRDSLLRLPDRAVPTKLRAVTKELTMRNGSALGRDAIMAVTKQVGMRPMREETIAVNIQRYKVVPPRAFAYNPMRLNIGSIAMSQFDRDVLVSPDYVVFACDESRLLPAYLHHVRHTQHWRNHFELAGNGSVRIRIYYDDLGTFTLPLPPVEIQAGVADFLDAAAREIVLLGQQLDVIRAQKRGLMQKLLTGQWRLSIHEQKENA